MGSTVTNPANAIPVWIAANKASGAVPVNGAGLVAALVAKASPGVSLGATASLPASQVAGWLVGYNAVAVPADGAINAALVLEAVPVAAGPSSVQIANAVPTSYSVGIVYYLTSGASPYAAKVSTGYAAFLSAKVL